MWKHMRWGNFPMAFEFILQYIKSFLIIWTDLNTLHVYPYYGKILQDNKIADSDNGRQKLFINIDSHYCLVHTKSASTLWQCEGGSWCSRFFYSIQTSYSGNILKNSFTFGVSYSITPLKNFATASSRTLKYLS